MDQVRRCFSCRSVLNRKSFSKTQLEKEPGKSRCANCVSGLIREPDLPTAANPTQQSATAWKERPSVLAEPKPESPGAEDEAPAPAIAEHEPDALTRTDPEMPEIAYAKFADGAFSNPFAEGSLLKVAAGWTAWGPGIGMVCKWLKPGVVNNEREFFGMNMKASRKAIDIIKRFEEVKLPKPLNKTIFVSETEVRKFEENPDDEDWQLGGVLHLQQPFVREFQKFNSNTGWCGTSTDGMHVMQGLSHFSYHDSGGELVLCDLQGEAYSSHIVLTDPVILSRSRDYGDTDLGVDGIDNFFSHHRCGSYCDRKWMLPVNPKPVKRFSPQEGTKLF
ncbi:kinase-like domain-containing protein [Podospora aff. communis PSN243]|uniref:Kinase-like domain-containing protein n=1 Tax=Podospora aff. communis PSN243 TaxID=3040156 RepID=A0AAV9G290_9PEZI|nr:kinase-like domain-containing protein [Podospora aff. communis PSN243]